MAVSSNTVGAVRAHTVTTFMRRVGAKVTAALKALQMARMLSALSNMSDYQLAQIGISRSDIPEYAAKMMADQ